MPNMYFSVVQEQKKMGFLSKKVAKYEEGRLKIYT
jgi:hypothetical protein